MVKTSSGELIELYFWGVIIFAFLAPVVPWIFAFWRGVRAAWTNSAKVLLALAVLAFLFVPACTVAGCGEGTMAFLPLWYAVGISICLTLGSAAVATIFMVYIWPRQSE